jgi:polyhydroxyalkanoate synthesis regulator phasin
LRQKLTEQTAPPPYYSHLIQKIHQWEQQSIDKIHQTADNARKDLENIIKQHSIQLTEALAKIADEINHARKGEGEYSETNIQEWTEEINKLKNQLVKSSTFYIHQDKNIIPFISKIYIDVLHNEVFDITLGNVELEDNDQVVVHGPTDSYATVRGKGEYVSGEHRLRLKIEEYHSSKWIFIGIISKNVSITENSINNRSIYGWAGPDQLYVNGIYASGFEKYRSDIQKNDILELLIDCDKRKINLMNERTHSSHELDINLSKCPFPWQLNLTMYFAGDRIRLLPP